MVLAAVPFGLAIGVAVGMLGGGGSVLAVPILVYVLGQSVSDATTTSLVVVTAGAVAGGLGHAREGRVCWRHAGLLHSRRRARRGGWNGRRQRSQRHGADRRRSPW